MAGSRLRFVGVGSNSPLILKKKTHVIIFCHISPLNTPKKYRDYRLKVVILDLTTPSGINLQTFY